MWLITQSKSAAALAGLVAMEMGRFAAKGAEGGKVLEFNQRWSEACPSAKENAVELS